MPDGYHTSCYQCTMRHAGCHSECEKYKADLKDRAEKKAADLKRREYNDYRKAQNRHAGYTGFGSLNTVQRRIERENARKFETKLRKENKRVTEKKLRES